MMPQSDNGTDQPAATVDHPLSKRPPSPLGCIGWFVAIMRRQSMKLVELSNIVLQRVWVWIA
ncbi:hypothetical protein RESH_04567 [Rhodopirellula europaea SH398]|uniref:Uncharacterized protein n=1 Tax=Rhodopirellula europaea SH398 TaxID=1263868 RepID=M5S083_9BACT|nr:hypothetical protein RESH_04567 [Rhodopirellula europaea SH398]